MSRYWKRKARIDIVPLLDVFVTLVFFFMIFGFLDDGSAALPVNLPGSRTAPPAESARFVIALNERGEYLIAGHAVTPAEVSRRVAGALAKAPALQVVLSPDRTVPYETLVAALDLIRAGGVERPALGVRREAAEPR